MRKDIFDTKKSKPNRVVEKSILVFVVAIITLLVLLTCFKTVSSGYNGVKLTFGKITPYSLQPGFHWKLPLGVQKIYEIETRTQKVEVTADSSSKDLQDVQTIIALNFHLDVTKVHELYQETGLDYNSRIIVPAIHETLKAVSARFTAEELITKRPEVKVQARDMIKLKLADYDILVDDLNIVNFQFSEEFDKAIELKVTAEQLKLKADRDLERIRVEAAQTVTRAQAEAEALRLQKQEVTEDLLRLREIENARLAITKWDGVMPKVTGGAIPFISVGELTT